MGRLASRGGEKKALLRPELTPNRIFWARGEESFQERLND